VVTEFIAVAGAILHRKWSAQHQVSARIFKRDGGGGAEECLFEEKEDWGEMLIQVFCLEDIILLSVTCFNSISTVSL